MMGAHRCTLKNARREADALLQRLMLADRRAYQIADAAVVSEIEINAVRLKDHAGLVYYDLRPMLDTREHCGEVIDLNSAALDHAAERGLIVSLPDQPHMVYVRRERLAQWQQPGRVAP